jgi:hypothetical protein
MAGGGSRASWRQGETHDIGISLFCWAQKGGTTTLHNYLRWHPQLCAPLQKKPHMFDNEAVNWHAPDFSAYHRMYYPTPEQILFDATPIHGFWQPSLERIAAYNPRAKLIFLFRDPFARAWSHWCMEWARGAEHLTFAEAIREGRARMPAEAPLDGAHRVFSYVERGRYGEQVARALRYFPREQMLFLKTETFARDHMAVLGEVTRFLGIRDFPTLLPRRDNARPDANYPPGPSEEDLALICGELAQDTRMFAELTGMDISDWMGPGALKGKAQAA